MVGGVGVYGAQKAFGLLRFYRCALLETDNASPAGPTDTLATMAMKSPSAGPKICSPRFNPLKRFAPLSKDTT